MKQINGQMNLFDFAETQKEERRRKRVRTTSEAFRKELREHCGAVCRICGAKENIEYHHLIPLSQGGTNDFQNIIALCHKCHMKVHGARHIEKTGFDGKTAGRPCKIDRDTAYKYFDMFVNGEIGRKKLNELCGYAESVHPNDLKIFKKYMNEKGIKKVHNTVDIIATNAPWTLKDGISAGWVEYVDGHKECIVFKDTGVNDIEYRCRKTNGLEDKHMISKEGNTQTETCFNCLWYKWNCNMGVWQCENSKSYWRGCRMSSIKYCSKYEVRELQEDTAP